MTLLKTEIAALNEQDTYSLILFALYKLREVPEYASISELAYVLDKNNLLKLCDYFGGMTIKIPTLKELEILVYTLVLVQMVNIEKKDFKESLLYIGEKSNYKDEITKNYNKLVEILSKYNFDRTTTISE